LRKDGTDDGGDNSNFRGKKRSNETHALTTDPDERLFKKSQGGEAHMAFLGHALTETWHHFAVAVTLTHATGTDEREAALVTMDYIAETGGVPAKPRTLGADKNYDTAAFVAECRARHIPPNVAQNTVRRSYCVSICCHAAERRGPIIRTL
jgi:hypothetical protein